ncbi:hypothetical protein IGI04_002838 [Brassica rapa subsp. trilocularis]|uniref:DUF287 domain-containing protein n=1 Tax=Brassica rapa subsp. trilocularis TaxID=1813537 RepID=A0ABQ7NXE5_BRACM|nr:hypothetical protein IGI04_002838 [Brassica rapa subsp. trilocularis]
MQEASHSKRESKGRRLVLEGDDSLSMGKDDLVSLAHRTRSMGCRPRARVLTSRFSHFTVMEALNEFSVMMEDHVHALRNKSEVEKGKVEKWVDKKKEVSADIQLHEVVANLDLLNEIKDEGLVVEDEIVCLKEMEKDCEAASSLAAVPDWSVAGLDLPQVSEDSINNEAASSSTRKEASS